MHRRRRGSFASIAALSTVGLLVAMSCERSEERWQGEVTIGVDLEAGQRWTAQGPPVDGGHLCPHGVRHVIEGRDPVTDDIVRVPVWWQVVEDAITSPNTTAVTLVVEHTCADGSGSFVTIERWGPDVWSVASGTGAYRGMTGAGDLTFATAHYTEVTPLRLYLDGMLQG